MNQVASEKKYNIITYSYINSTQLCLSIQVPLIVSARDRHCKRLIHIIFIVEEGMISSSFLLFLTMQDHSDVI